jgi:lysophospholipase L1-like esterase
MTEFYTPEQDKRSLGDSSAMRDDLPNAFLIGDSISCGYTDPVTQFLQGIANVQRAPDNCGDTRRGLSDLDRWLGDGTWDVVHFNWGLHDLCYRHPEATVYGNRDKTNGVISVPLDEYRENLEELVTRLKTPGRALIWATTTLVPAGEVGRFEGDEIRYNEAAAEIMRRHGIAINDLHALSASFAPTLFAGPGDVHYTQEGSRELGRQVAQCILQALHSAGRTDVQALP